MKRLIIVIFTTLFLFSPLTSEIVIADEAERIIVRGQRTTCPPGTIMVMRTFVSYGCVRLGSGAFRGMTYSGGYGSGGGGDSSLTETPESEDKESDPDQCEKGNPILIGTGNKLQTDVDFIGMGEFPLTVVRNYNNFSNHSGVFGNKWIASFESKLTFNGSYPYYSIDKHGAQGEIIRYYVDSGFPSGGFYQARNNDVVNTVQRQSDGGYKLSAGSGYSEKYNSSGKLLEKRFPGGITHTYSYTNGNLTKITHSSGRFIALNWSSGKVSSLTDNAGNNYTYSYSGGYLAGASKPGSPSVTRTYIYGDSRFPGALTQININGTKYATFAYNSSGKGKSTSHWASSSTEVEKYQFSFGTNLTTVTNPLGHSDRYRYQEINGVNKLVKVERLYSPNCPSANKNIAYDSKGMTDYTLDWKGVKTDYTYNDNGQLLSQTYAKGTPDEKTTYFTWNNGESYVTKIETLDLRTEYEYDSLARVTKTTLTNLSQHGVAAEKRIVSTSYTSHSNGVTASKTIDGPRTDVADTTTLYYDNKGNLTSIQNSKGHTVTYSNYDSLGNPRRITSVNGLITDYTYDAQGKILTQKVHHLKGLQTTSFTYNALGLITRVDLPDGNFVRNVYDQAYRLTKTLDRVGSYILYTRNANSDVISRKIMKEFTVVVMPPPDCGGFEPFMTLDEGISNQLRTLLGNCEPTVTTEFRSIKTDNYQYDAMGRLQKALGVNGQVADYQYDDNSNISQVVDSYGNSTVYSYDALNRVKSVTDPSGKVTQYSYDNGGRTASVTDARGLTTTYKYSGFGELEEIISPDTGVTTYSYNKAGQVTQIIRGSGITSNFTYDAIGRIKTESSGSSSKTYAYDSGTNRLGRLYYVNDSSGQTVYWYDSVGNITRKRSKIDGIYYNTYYAYDGMNRVTQVTYPSGHKILYSYDNKGQISQVSYNDGASTINVVSDIKYLPFGPTKEYQYGNGIYRFIDYDVSFRPTRIYSHPVQDLSYTYDNNNNITKIQNSKISSNTQTYTYDSLNRLKTANSASKGNYSYYYDSVGNRTKHYKNGVLQKTYSYSSTSNQLTQTTSGGLIAPYNYNSNGNLSATSNESFTYNSENRLSQYSKSGQTTQFKHNAMGQRTSKSSSYGTYHYLYDETGLLIAEHDSSSTVLKEYVYLHGKIIGVIKNNVLYYVHNDHLGRAERISNGTQSTVWRASNYEFDRVVEQDSIGNYNPGFPGQYFDQETGLYYNYFRDYDPSIGRYIQSDPIGQTGGINTYTYVNNMPTSYIDPLGLKISCAGLVDQMMAIISHPKMVDRGQLGGFFMGAAYNLARNGNTRNTQTSGFRPELVSGGQNGDVIRHVYMNAGGVVTGGNAAYSVYGGMQALDHADLARGSKTPEAMAEMAGNLAGAKVGDAINKSFDKIKNGSECEKQTAIDQLKSQIGDILCN
ncbi:RHS repeat-associated core domain-containing protein [Kangiella spongicola]|uniref:RHS repeat protein n=1 Tax=Kangiella spongicola TaxID=796379 RepID=A0A318CZZ9_9GAMM|nr:RHS repeat-associated core domain-containing protein [Kangiella spongicola]PXF62562.1 hypothetical protein DL796_09480 [Kangiella spongicola]